MAAQKVYDFILVFKGNSLRLVNRITRMMLLLALAVFVFVSIPVTKSSILSLTLSFIILAWWLVTEYRLRKGKQAYFRLALLLAAWGWYLQPNGKIIALIYLVSALLEKQVTFPQELAFDEEEIVFNSFPRKHFSWNAVNNVVLKDGLLTIDFVTNRLIQKELESFPSIKEEAEFNAFCKRMLLRESSIVNREA